MSILKMTMATALVVSLNACTHLPPRSDTGRVETAVRQANDATPRLPTASETYLDPAWFDEPLTRDRAVQAVLLNNPGVRAELSRLDAAQAERVQAGLLSNPMLSLMALRPNGGGRFELDYGLMQSLFDLVARSRRIAAADAAQVRIEADVTAQLIGGVQATEQAYYELVTAHARLDLRREQLALETDMQRLLHRQAQQGAIPTEALLAQEATTALLAYQVREAQGGLAMARANLAARLGLTSAADIRLPAQAPAETVPGLDLVAAQVRAARHRPDLQAAAAEVEQARAERALASGSLRSTTPRIGPAGVRESDGGVLNGLGLELMLPIFDTGRASRDLAEARLAQAEHRAEAVRRQVPRDVEQAVAMLLSAEQALQEADRQLEYQGQRERLARRGYEQGLGDAPANLRARAVRLAAELDRIEARQTLWSALVRLEQAIGASLP